MQRELEGRNTQEKKGDDFQGGEQDFQGYEQDQDPQMKEVDEEAEMEMGDEQEYPERDIQVI